MLTACAHSRRKAMPIHIFYSATLTLACKIPIFFRTMQDSPTPKPLSSKVSLFFSPLVHLELGLAPGMNAPTGLACPSGQGFSKDISFCAALAAALYIAALFGCTYHDPAPKSLTRQIFCCHTGIPLRSVHSARPAGSGRMPGSRGCRHTSSAPCAAGYPSALQKRSETGQCGLPAHA